MRKYWKVLFLFLVSLVMIHPVQAQTAGGSEISRLKGLFFANSYNVNLGTVYGNPTSSGTATIMTYSGLVTLADGRTINPFSTVASSQPLTITNGQGTDSFTPTASSGCGTQQQGSCSITASFTYPHGQGDIIRSGTGGLQEAINDAHGIGGIVYVSNVFAGTASTITSAYCYTNVEVLSILNGYPVSYNCSTNGNGYAVDTADRISAYCSGTVGSAETELLNNTTCSGATSSTVAGQFIMPTAGTIANLQVLSSANAVGGSGKDVMTVLDNTTGQALTCTIAAGAKPCSDTTHSFFAAAGDSITFQFVTATSDTAANIKVSVSKY